jgi:signal transduction histidine kinase/AmiR/NasT family two-component response regulator
LLLVEDSEDDALLVLRQLSRAGYELACSQVATQPEFIAALAADTWDVIISDHSLPGYGGLTALADLIATGKDIPFILVSGSIGEAIAVTAMKAGAQDYVLKGDLTRLPVAVEREVREAAVRADQVKIRERLMISERMASAGTLAAGIAHEINNPLAIVMGNLEMTSEALGRAVAQARELVASGGRGLEALTECLAELEEPIRDSREGAQRIRDIIRDVKLFSRPDDESPCRVDIHRVANSSIRMAYNEIRHRAKVVKDYGDVPMVNANESRLGQVLLNLIVNAAQSIPEGRADTNEIRVTTRTADDGFAIVEVSDTGSGIPKANLERIFDPFFTTKPVGVGTGIGLAICRHIVAEIGGRIEVESVVGEGTLFRLALPRADKGSGVVPVARAVKTGPRRRVLIVDDDAALGRAVGRGLSGHHDATIVTSGADALARIGSSEPFDVILMDVMMPEMSGMELYERLRALAPKQAEQVVFLTGGAFSPAAREFLDRVPSPRLDKPFKSEDLLAIVEEVAERLVESPASSRALRSDAVSSGRK